MKEEILYGDFKLNSKNLIGYNLTLEYYITVNKKTNSNNPLYGVKIRLITEFNNEDYNIEEKEMDNIFHSQDEAYELLNILKSEHYTPTCLEDVLQEYLSGQLQNNTTKKDADF